MRSTLYTRGFLDRLEALAESKSISYKNAEPFPHIVIDDFLPGDIVQEVLEAFPTRSELHWKEQRNQYEMKRSFTDAEGLPPQLTQLFHFFNSAVILRFLETLTGIDGLLPDPYFHGGGLHEIEPGGKLEIHADFNKLEKFALDRRLNLLLYLNNRWIEDYGGHLELWDGELKQCVRRILPIINRCVIFSTTDNAYHGHPHPLSCPPDRTRRSIALYYYSNGRPEEQQSGAHSTLWRGAEERPSAAAKVSRIIRACTPPIILDVYRHVRKR